MRLMRHFLLLGLALAAPLAGAQEPRAVPDRVQFNRDIRPILSENCFKCHGPDARARQSGLRLDQREGAVANREGVFAVVPGSLEKSELVRRITSTESDEKMPPPKSGKKLAPREIALLKRWIEQGAGYEGHWSFVPPRRAALPAVLDAAWPRNPIDRFVLSRLEREGLRPSPEADRVTLVRRLHFDLTGLPPAPEEVDAFLADAGRDAAGRQVERLLSSPHHGERLALLWLDLVRFGDSRGFHSDNPRNVSAYRDYVIRAFNANTRFDRFTIEQLAGDLLPDPGLWQRVASGYNRINLTTEEGGAQPREYEAKTNADRVRNAGAVWLGATVGCAECHDHKFDPFTMRDFYGMAAFFADVKESAIADRDPGIPVPDEEQAPRLRALDEEVAALKARLEADTPELRAAQAEWERRAMEATPWTVLEPAGLKSAGGAKLDLQKDGSVAVTGKNPPKDTYTFTARTNQEGVTAFLLEALADASLPGSGPGRSAAGNFVLTGFRVATDRDVSVVRAAADHSQEGWPVAHALDDKGATGWAVLPQTGRSHAAMFEVRPLGGPGGAAVSFTLEFQSPHPQHALGRFRISATTSKSPVPGAVLPPAIEAILRAPAEKRTAAQRKQVEDHFRASAPVLAPLRASLAAAEKRRSEFLKTVRTSLVTTAAPPRTVRILPRGDWLNGSGEEVKPAVPAFLGKLEVGDRRATRLDLAEWLVSPSHPLTARVFVNRLWRHFFGVGLSKSMEDLGTQGEWPVHPELLDWLAVEFVESGWDVRHVVRLMVTSAAYRQSSAAPKALRDRDPFNRLVARQSRWRLDAELVRDNALAVSGLLVRKLGGESVKPYQPAGYWFHLNFPKREWANDRGENAWRRGIYTWWQRTFPHPSMLAFDAPNREECAAERPRSNIPQQALALLNDPTYVEAARVFAERILREGGGGLEERLAWACRRALSRRPEPDEVKVLSDLYRGHLEQFAADRKAAEQLVSTGHAPVAKDLDAAELAAWTSVARAILNLHETITRN